MTHKLLPGQDPVTGEIAAEDMTDYHLSAIPGVWQWRNSAFSGWNTWTNPTLDDVEYQVNERWRPVGWEPVPQQDDSEPHTSPDKAYEQWERTAKGWRRVSQQDDTILCNCDQALACERENKQLREECASLHAMLADLLRR